MRLITAIALATLTILCIPLQAKAEPSPNRGVAIVQDAFFQLFKELAHGATLHRPNSGVATGHFSNHWRTQFKFFGDKHLKLPGKTTLTTYDPGTLKGTLKKKALWNSETQSVWIAYRHTYDNLRRGLAGPGQHCATRADDIFRSAGSVTSVNIDLTEITDLNLLKRLQDLIKSVNSITEKVTSGSHASGFIGREVSSHCVRETRLILDTLRVESSAARQTLAVVRSFLDDLERLGNSVSSHASGTSWLSSEWQAGFACVSAVASQRLANLLEKS